MLRCPGAGHRRRCSPIAVSVRVPVPPHTVTAVTMSSGQWPRDALVRRQDATSSWDLRRPSSSTWQTAVESRILLEARSRQSTGGSARSRGRALPKGQAIPDEPRNVVFSAARHVTVPADARGVADAHEIRHGAGGRAPRASPAGDDLAWPRMEGEPAYALSHHDRSGRVCAFHRGTPA